MMGRGYEYGYDTMMGGWGWFGGMLMLLLVVLVIVGIVLLVLWAARATGGHGSSHAVPPVVGRTGHDEALAIAKRRLASGEITTEQYQEIIRTLGP